MRAMKGLEKHHTRWVNFKKPKKYYEAWEVVFRAAGKRADSLKALGLEEAALELRNAMVYLQKVETGDCHLTDSP